MMIKDVFHGPSQQLQEILDLAKKVILVAI
jgi:hypothetical protein